MIHVDATGRAVAAASARGASHIRRHKPNQDAIGGFARNGWALVASSDGHGAERCFRSDRGSRFVVESLEHVCSTLVANRRPREIPLSEYLAAPQLVVTDWRARVRRDAASDVDSRLSADEPFEAYGATCVAALIGDGVVLFMQVGDGDIVVGARGGELGRPLPDDEGLVGEQTYSICLPEAVPLFRTLLIQAPHPLATPDFVAVSSDGLAKSFANTQDFLDVMRQWRELAATKGLESLEPQLEGWLSDCSSRGSGDDASLTIYFAGLDGPAR